MKNKEITRWHVLLAACMINLCIGSLYAWSVFSEPMAGHLTKISGKAVQNLSVVFTLANAVGPITMILGGVLEQKLGNRKTVMLGAVLFAGGMILSAFATGKEMLILTYGLGVGLGVGMIYGCTVSLCVRIFPDKRGLAGGLSTATYGISSVIIPPIANALIQKMGIQAAFIGLGSAMFLIISFAASFLKFPERKKSGEKAPGQQTTNQQTWKQMLKTPVFYVMLVMLCCGAFSGLMFISQASPLAQRMLGMGSAQAASIVSALALFNTFGRIVAGSLSDRLGHVRTLRLAYLLSLLGLLSLRFGGEESILLFCLGICAVGFSFGALMGIYPGFTSTRFGEKNNGVNYGIMFIGFAAAGFFGPGILAATYAKTGADHLAFVIAMVFSLCGLALTGFYQKLVLKMEAKR